MTGTIQSAFAFLFLLLTDLPHPLSAGARSLLAELWPALLALSLFGFVNIFRTRRRAERTYQWPSVSGVVTKSRIKKGKYGSSVGHGNSRTTIYKPGIVYAYSVEGQRFEGTRIQFGVARRDFVKARMEQVIEHYPEGKAVQVHYDPNRPGESVLEVGTATNLNMGMLLSLVMMALGIVGLMMAGQ